MVHSFFQKSPIEADDLATLLQGLRTHLQDEPDDFGPELLAEYLKQLLRTRIAETQFKMLSGAEKEVLRELVNATPASKASELRVSLRDVL